VIGDRCFEYEKDLRENGETAVSGLDLGGAWLEMTGLPFVFAVWAAAPGLRDRVGDAGIEELKDQLIRARDYGLANLQAIADREAAAGRLGRGGEASPEALGYYFKRSLRYVIGEEELAGLRRFHELCIQHGVAPSGASPSFL
jgi:predicted solute-binding protein